MESPRDWLKDSVYFAKGTRLWKPANTPSEMAERRAAIWQERVILRLKQELGGVGRTQLDLAEAVGLSKDTVSRLVTGETWIQFRHIALFEQELRVNLTEGTRPDLD